jgi:hypothetical protein
MCEKIYRSFVLVGAVLGAIFTLDLDNAWALLAMLPLVGNVNIPTHYVMEFSSNVTFLLQQKGSKLRGTVTEGRYVGKQASPVDQFGQVEAQRVTSRFGPMNRIDAPTDRRWVYPVDWDLPQMIDHFDKLRLVTNPESSLVTNAMFAMGRAMDTEIINAFTGTAKTGEQGATSTSFTSGNEVDVATGGANSKVNVEKLKSVKLLMLQNFVDFDMEQVTLGLTGADEANLWGEIQVVSSDFNGGVKPVLQDGKVRRFMGIDFVYCELIEAVAAGTNEVDIPVWCKSGMHLGIWNDMQTSISKRNDLQGEPYQAYVLMSIGATRLEEDKVYNIESYRA